MSPKSFRESLETNDYIAFREAIELDDYMRRRYELDVEEAKKQLNNYNQMANPKPGMKEGSKSTNHKKEEAAGLKPFKVKTKKK